MKKIIILLLTLAVAATALISCAQNNVEDIDTYKFKAEFLDKSVKEETVVIKDGETLGAALEALGYIKTEDGVITNVFGQGIAQLDTDVSGVYWQLYINGEESDKKVGEIIPEKDAVYSVSLIAYIK